MNDNTEEELRSNLNIQALHHNYTAKLCYDTMVATSWQLGLLLETFQVFFHERIEQLHMNIDMTLKSACMRTTDRKSVV